MCIRDSRGTGMKKLYLIFGMCDESFSINYTADIPEDTDRGWFMFFVTLLNHFYWFFGAALGGIAGSLISFNTEGLELDVYKRQGQTGLNRRRYNLLFHAYFPHFIIIFYALHRYIIAL